MEGESSEAAGVTGPEVCAQWECAEKAPQGVRGVRALSGQEMAPSSTQKIVEGAGYGTVRWWCARMESDTSD